MQQQEQEYPLVAYNYRVIVGSMTMRFSRVEGLTWERSAIIYRDGLSFLEGELMNTYRIDRYVPITLQQGVVAQEQSLLEWLMRGDQRVLQILLCRSDGQPTLSWKSNRAIPIKLTPSTLDANSNDVAIDTLELQARGWSVNHLR